MKPVVQLTRTGVKFFGSTKRLRRLRETFDRRHHLVLPQFLDEPLLNEIRRQVREARFYERVHKNIGSEACMRSNAAYGLLQFLADSPRLFELIETLTGCERIGCFDGRVYRMVPGAGHTDRWHDDMVEHRMIAMSVNLSDRFYRGGTLKLRDSLSRRRLSEIANTGFGDALIFRLSKSLQHRVTDVVGRFPKTAFAGWFRSKPSFETFFRKKNRRLPPARRPLEPVMWPVRWRVAGAVAYRFVGHEAHLFHPSRQLHYVLNPIGRKLLEFLEDGASAESALRNLHDEYRVSFPKLKNDVGRFMASLRSGRLIEPV